MHRKTIVRSKKEKKARDSITNVSMNILSKIIEEFEKLPLKGYAWNIPKHEPTYRSF